MEFISGPQPHGYLIMFYGPPGVGKSTEASKADNPVFLDLEGGLNQIGCTRTAKKIETFNEFIESLRAAAGSQHRTVVVDTITALETILCDEILTEYNEGRAKKAISISQIPYGQGGDMLAARWSYVVKLFQKTQKECGKNIILVGHSSIQKVEDPTSENYDRFCVDINKKTLGVIVNNVDGVFLCRQKVYARQKDTDKGKFKATTDGERVLFCYDKPAYLAKNRFSLPDEIPMGGEVFKLLHQFNERKNQ